MKKDKTVYCEHRWGKMIVHKGSSWLLLPTMAYKICTICKRKWDAFDNEPQVRIGYILED